MVRQYRIDRFNGMEILVCEVYRKHLFTQQENEALFHYNEEHKGAELNNAEFRHLVDEELSKEGVEQFAGLKYPIPFYDSIPEVILRGPVVENRIVSLQVDYLPSVVSPQVFDEVRRFYNFVENRHWRNTIDHQLYEYGSLFSSEDN